MFGDLALIYFSSLRINHLHKPFFTIENPSQMNTTQCLLEHDSMAVREFNKSTYCLNNGDFDKQLKAN